MPATSALYKHMKDIKEHDKEVDNEAKEYYYLDDLNKQIKDEEKPWKDIFVSKKLVHQILPKRIDNLFANLHDYMRQWLKLYELNGEIITKCKDPTRNVEIVFTTYGFQHNGETMFVVKEVELMQGTVYHHVLSTKEIANKYNNVKFKLPKQPNCNLAPDKKKHEQIKNILENVTERYKTIADLKEKYLQQKMDIFGRKQKYKFMCCYTAKEFFDCITKSCGEQMKDIRLEPVLAFDETGYHADIDYVWIIAITSTMDINQLFHIGISVLPLDGECIAKAVYLSIYDQQKLLLIEPRDKFISMHNIKIGNYVEQKSTKTKKNKKRDNKKQIKNTPKPPSQSNDQSVNDINVDNNEIPISPELLLIRDELFPHMPAPPHPAQIISPKLRHQSKGDTSLL